MPLRNWRDRCAVCYSLIRSIVESRTRDSSIRQSVDSFIQYEKRETRTQNHFNKGYLNV